MTSLEVEQITCPDLEDLVAPGNSQVHGAASVDGIDRRDGLAQEEARELLLDQGLRQQFGGHRSTVHFDSDGTVARVAGERSMAPEAPCRPATRLPDRAAEAPGAQSVAA